MVHTSLYITSEYAALPENKILLFHSQPNEKIKRIQVVMSIQDYNYILSDKVVNINQINYRLIPDHIDKSKLNKFLQIEAFILSLEED
jgi:hypothetical protein